MVGIGTLQDVEPWEIMELGDLVSRYLPAMQPLMQEYACLLGGIGSGCVLAYELGIKLQSAGTDVR